MTLEEINLMKPEFKGLLCLNQKQTAEILGVSSSTLENWRKEGIGPEYKKVENQEEIESIYKRIEIYSTYSIRDFVDLEIGKI